MSDTADTTTSTLSQEQRALIALRRMRAKLDEIERTQNEPLAIIGMGCRFPGGVKSPADFWELLHSGRDAITEVPSERWDADVYYDPDVDAPGKMTSRWGGFLDRIDQFDAGFFGIAPREATYMDPQQRLLLEVTWEALERAGQTTEQLAGSATGVFVAVCNNDYRDLFQDLDPAQLNAYIATGNASSIAANRLSYILDLRGPSIAIDTACSSSLVALHLACQSLRNGECTLALAGGVNLILSPYSTVTLSKARMLAADGRCKTFDSLADGFVRGEGCGMVALKRLSQAQKDGDPILALVHGSAVNQDGHSNGLTAPNVQAQQAVLRQALQQARVEVEQVGYIETHGTGTPLGDPIEIEALSSIYGKARVDKSHCMLGAVKSSIGHLEAAAGIAGVIKVILALQKGEIPPNLHFTRLNPNIQLGQTPFVIPTTVCPWPVSSSPHYAAISSFGFGGTNAHVILEEAPPSPRKETKRQAPGMGEWAYLLPLSAQSPHALLELVSAYHQELSVQSHLLLADICYTASLHRNHYPYRLGIMAHTREELLMRLQSAQQRVPEEKDVSLLSVPGSKKLVFVFAGQGAQWAGMGVQLHQQEPVFREVLDRCDHLLQQSAGWSLLQELAAPATSSRLNETAIAQPALFAIQVALAALWRSWGIVPEAVLGHSVGEVAAAHLAGAFGLEEALRIVMERGSCMQMAHGQGAMLSVSLSADEAQPLLAPYGDQVVIAAINSATSVVLSGQTECIAELRHTLEQKGQQVRTLEVAYAFHSPQMRRSAEQLAQRLKGLVPQSTEIPFVSTVTGQRCQGQELTASYWARNVLEPVQFAMAIEQVSREQECIMLEIGPHPVLRANITQCLAVLERPGHIVSSLRRGQAEYACLLQSLGMLYMYGCQPRWQSFYPERGQTVPLPTYPWQRRRFWLPDNQRHETRTSIATPASSIKIGQKTFSGVLFRSALGQVSFEIGYTDAVHDALLQKDPTLSSLHEELLRGVGKQVFGDREQCIENVVTHELLMINKRERCVVQVILDTEKAEAVPFQIFSTEKLPHISHNTWHLHISGVLRIGPEPVNTAADNGADMQAIQPSNGNGRMVPDLWQQLQHASIEERQKMLEELISFEMYRVLEFQTPTIFGGQQRFMDLGLDSLMAVELARRLEAQIGCPFPPLMIEHHPTIAGLARYLVSLLAGSAAETASPLLVLQDAGEGLPFFCVPGVFGTTSILHEFAQHLGPQQPFYALQSVGMTPLEEHLTSIEEIATFYNQAISQVQPQGPYRLGGWSFGGVVAFEMASQFRRKGQEVTLLAMIDSSLASVVPESGKSEEDIKVLIDVAKFIAFSLGKHLTVDTATLARLTPDEREAAVMGQVVELGTTQAEREYIRSIQKTCKKNLQALKHYTPKIYDREILFFQARQKIDEGQGIGFTDESTAAWRPYSAKPLQVYPISGNHFTMMKEPYVQQIANDVQQRLQLSAQGGRR